MLDVYSNSTDSLERLRSEVEKARRLGILGETGSGVAAEHRDEQAEGIESLIDAITGLVDELNGDEESKPHAWYFPHAILASIFRSYMSDTRELELQARVGILVKNATEVTITTARFRKQYEHIYQAAFYATLPELTIRHEIRIGDDSLKHCSVSSIVDAGLRLEKPPFTQYSPLSMELDTIHLLDKKLVSLSIGMANLLEMAWKQHQVVGAIISDLVYYAGGIFQNLLVASQSNMFVRMSAASFLNEISYIITQLDKLVRSKGSMKTSLASIMMRPSSVKMTLRHQKEVTEFHSARHETQTRLDRLMHQIDLLTACNPIPTVHGDELEVTGDNGRQADLSTTSAKELQSNSASAQKSPSQELTFQSITQAMKEYSSLEMFDRKPEKQNFSSGVTRSEGSYADVYRIKLPEERKLSFEYCPRPGTPTIQIRWYFDEVAVKVIRFAESEQITALRAVREFAIWSRMHHPNIIPLAGIWFNFDPCSLTKLPAFVSPWLKRGSLSRYLSSRQDMTRKQRLRFLLDIARALAYMHNHKPRVCHGDINPENVLVLHGKAFVCDFGISHISAPYHDMTTNLHGDWRYRAPEQLGSGFISKPTPQSDMYSFGSLCFKVLTDLNPWDGVAEGEGVRILNPHAIMPRPLDMRVDDYNFLRYCWKNDPRLRATANVAIEELKILVSLENCR